MKALQGVEGRAEWADRPSLTCDVGQIRIRVAAAGLNRADLLQIAGHYPPPPGASDTLGLAILVALNIADEFFRARELQQSNDGALALRAGELERIVDQALALADDTRP